MTWPASGSLGPGHRTYLSLNRTGLAGSAFELDDRLVASVWRAAEDGWTGVKHMTRIDPTDPVDRRGPRAARPGARGGEVGRAGGTGGVGGLAGRGHGPRHRLGGASPPWSPTTWARRCSRSRCPTQRPAGPRVEAVARVVASVGVPVLFLGGPRREGGRDLLLDEVADVMAGGGAGMAVGRAVYQDPDPAGAARAVADVVHGTGGPPGP